MKYLRKTETETEVPTLQVPRMEKADRGFAAAAAAAGIKAGGHEQSGADGRSVGE